jgi:predicted nucleotidyltransferase
VVEQAVIEEAARRLVRAAGESDQVVLFGSHARGDLHFLVVEPQVENEAE